MVSVTTPTQRHTARSLSGHDAEIPPAEVATRHRKSQAARSGLVASRLRDSAVFTLAARLSDQVSPTCPLAPSPRLPKLTKTRTGRCCGNTLADGMGK